MSGNNYYVLGYRNIPGTRPAIVFIPKVTDGDTGPTGPKGDQFLTSFTQNITPVSGGTLASVTVGKGLAYIRGNSVVVVSASSGNNRFEGIVSSYDSSSGALVIYNLSIYSINNYKNYLIKINLKIKIKNKIKNNNYLIKYYIYNILL